MTIHRLTVVKRGSGTVFSCPDCNIPGMAAYGAANKAEMVFLLICPKCQITLAEWSTVDARGRELKEFAERASS
jgi:hypothetical protein